jgi:hypothetical protein
MQDWLSASQDRVSIACHFKSRSLVSLMNSVLFFVAPRRRVIPICERGLPRIQPVRRSPPLARHLSLLHGLISNHQSVQLR